MDRKLCEQSENSRQAKYWVGDNRLGISRPVLKADIMGAESPSEVLNIGGVAERKYSPKEGIIKTANMVSELTNGCKYSSTFHTH